MSGGGSLGLGKSESSQSSNSISAAYGYQGSESSDIARAISEATSGGTSTSGQSVFQGDLYAKLFGGATGAADSALARTPELMTQAKALFTGGTEFMDLLGGGEAMEYLNSRVTGENPLLQENIDALREDTGRLFREEFNPAITSSAVAGGSLGGGRQGVAQGMAMDSAAREFTRGATALRTGDMAARDSAAATALQGTLQGASTGLGSLPMLMDMATTSAAPELGIYSNLAAILGGPTTLTASNSEDFSRSNSQSLSDAFARSFGENQSSSQSSSRGRSNAWNLSMSGYGGMGASSGG
jgi:hypothetical protein